MGASLLALAKSIYSLTRRSNSEDKKARKKY